MKTFPVKPTDPIKTGQVFVYREGISRSEIDRDFYEIVKGKDLTNSNRNFSTRLPEFFSPDCLININTKKVIAVPVWILRSTVSSCSSVSLDSSFQKISPIVQELNANLVQNSLSLRPETFTKIEIQRIWATPDLKKLMIVTVPRSEMDTSSQQKVETQLENWIGRDRLNEIDDDAGVTNTGVMANSVLEFFMKEVEVHNFLRVNDAVSLVNAVTKCQSCDLQDYLSAIDEYRRTEASCRTLKLSFNTVRQCKSNLRMETNSHIAFLGDAPEIKKIFLKEKMKCV